MKKLSKKIREPLVFAGVSLEEKCSNCNGSGISKILKHRFTGAEIPWQCVICKGTGCALNENGIAILQLIESH